MSDNIADPASLVENPHRDRLITLFDISHIAVWENGKPTVKQRPAFIPDDTLFIGNYICEIEGDLYPSPDWVVIEVGRGSDLEAQGVPKPHVTIFGPDGAVLGCWQFEGDSTAAKDRLLELLPDPKWHGWMPTIPMYPHRVEYNDSPPIRWPYPPHSYITNYFPKMIEQHDLSEPVVFAITRNEHEVLAEYPDGITTDHKDFSRSGIGYSVIKHLLSKGVYPAEVARILENPAWPVGEYLREKSNPGEAITRDIQNAFNSLPREIEDEPVEVPKDRELAPWPDPLPRRPILIPGLAQRKVVTVIAGAGGDGKSLYTLQMGIAAAVGKPFAHWEPVGPMKVLYLNLEDDRDEVQRRASAICAVMGIEPAELRGRFHHMDVNRFPLLKKNKRPEEDQPEYEPTGYNTTLRNLIQEERYDLVILDPLIEMHTGLDENSNDDMKELMQVIRGMSREGNAAIFAVHHFRKGGQSGEADSARGGSAIINSCRVAITLARASETAKARNWEGDPNLYIQVSDAKQNYAAKEGDNIIKLLPVELSNGEVVPAFIGFDLPTGEDADDTVIALLESPPEGGWLVSNKAQKASQLRQALATAIRADVKTADAVLERMFEAGMIDQVEVKRPNGKAVKVWERRVEIPF